MKPSSENGPKLIQFEREGWRDGVQALKAIVTQLESGEIAPVSIGALVMLGTDGQLEVFGFGPRAEPLELVGLLRYAEQRIMGR